MTLMEQRFSWRFSHKLQATVRPSPLISWRLWLPVIGMTAVYLLWLSYRWLAQPAWIQQLPALLGELLLLTELSAGVALGVVWLIMGWQQKQRTAQPRPTWTLDELYALSPREFEQFAARLFRRRGYKVKVRGRSGDLGVDLEVTNRNGRRAIVQCKRYRSTISPAIVRELYGTLMHEAAAHGFLVTTADISDAARNWAQGKPLTLIDGPTLVELTATLSQPAA